MSLIPSIYLPLALQEIRLLDLQPGTVESPCECHLRTVQLSDKPRYHALSYTWGTGQKDNVVRCNGHSIMVTVNLSHALQRLRKPDRIYSLWIDQICINQDDLSERMQQVALMGQIYSMAETVDVWLGEANEGENVDLAMKFIPRLLEAYEDPSELSDQSKEPNVIQKLSILVIRSPEWNAVENLFARPYFRRMWIVQEVSLGTIVNVYCGPYSTDWHSLALAARCTGSIEVEPNPEAHAVINMIQNFRRDRRLGHNQPLPQLLSQVFFLLCSNPLDKIYGILGLVREDQSKDIKADYELSVQNLFIKTATTCILRDQTLAVLSDVRGPKHISHIPSWVPDWTSTPCVQQSIGRRGRLSEYRTVDLETVIYISDDLQRLSTHGCCIGEVSIIGPIMPDINNDDIYLEWQSIVRSCSPSSGETYPRTFWRTIIAHDPVYIMYTDEDLESFYAATENLKIRNRIVSAKSGEPWEPIAEMSVVNSRSMIFDEFWRVSVGRRLFTTSGGGIGLGPPDMREGDEICVLHGGLTPLILREAGCKRHHLVGEAYVLGATSISANYRMDELVQYQIV